MSLNFEDEGVLYGLACECERLFDQLFEALKIVGAHSDICQLYAEFQQRFTIWAAHLGVFARKSQCLDRRLRSFPDLQDIVSRLLDILRRSLFQCVIEIQSKTGEESSTIQEDGALVLGPSHEEAVHMRAIDDVITRLSRLGVTIRQSNRPNIDAKVKKFLEGHDLRPFTSLCENAVQSLYPGAHPSLHEYLSKSMTDRYAKMLFQDFRHKKLETRRESPPELPPRSPKRNEGQRKPAPIPQETIIINNPKPSTHLVPAISSISQSDLSSVNIKIVRDRLRQSLQASTLSSHHKSSTVLFTQSNYPNLPTSSYDSRVIKCEWCAQFLNKSLLSAKDWRRHVDRDLKPYVCLSEQCPEGHPTYPTFDEWDKHMVAHGRRWHQNIYLASRWFCPFCDSNQDAYGHPEALYVHLDREHSTTFPPEQLQAISRQSKTERSRERNDCLLCCFTLEEQDDEASFPKRRKGLVNQQPSKSPRKYFYEKGPEGRKSDDEISTSSSDSEDSTIDQNMGINSPPKGISRHIAGHLQVLMILTTRFGALMNQGGDLEGDIHSDSVDVDEGGSESNGNDLGKLSDIDSDEDSLMEEKSDASTTRSDPDLDDSYLGDITAVPDTDFDIEVIPRQHDNLRPEDDTFMKGILESGAYRAIEYVGAVEDTDSKTTTQYSLWNDVKEHLVLQNDREKVMMLERRVDNRQTPLSWVTSAGWLPLARILLQKGAKPNEGDKRDGRTPLHLATLFWHKEIVQLLLEYGADVNSKDIHLETPLHIAATHKRDDIVSMLLEYGADISATNDKGQTPLCVSGLHGGCVAVAQLLIAGGAEVNHKDLGGNTPLGLASAKGHQEIVRLFLNYGAEVDLEDDKGLTPLGLASAKGHKEVVQLLILRGADLERRDMNGRRPQSLALDNGHEEVIEVLTNTGGSSITQIKKDDGHLLAAESLDKIMPKEPFLGSSTADLEPGSREFQFKSAQVADSLSSWPLVDRTTSITPFKESYDKGEEHLGNKSLDSLRSDSPKPQSRNSLLKLALQKANTAVKLDNNQTFEDASQVYAEVCEILQRLQRTANYDDKQKLEAINRTYRSRITELEQVLSFSQRQHPVTVGQVTSINQTSDTHLEGSPATGELNNFDLEGQRLVLKSLIESETAFVLDMTILEEIYKGTSEACPTLDANSINLIFGNCDKIIEFHTDFLGQLKKAAESTYSIHGARSNQQIEGLGAEGYQTSIGAVFLVNMAKMRAIHQKFMQNRDKREKYLRQMQRHDAGRNWLDACRNAAKDLTQSRPDIDSLVQQPIQRIVTFRTLLSEIADKIPEGHMDNEQLRDAMESLKKLDLEMHQSQNHHEITRQILDKKRKDSNLTRVISRRVDKIRVPNIEIPEDESYTKLRERFGDDYLRIQVILRDIDFHLQQVSAYEEELLRYISSMELMMRLSPSKHPELESKWAQFNIAVRTSQKNNLERHVLQIQDRVILPLKHVLGAYGNPSTAMTIRQELRLDYEQAEKLKRDGKKASPRLMKLVEQYDALNGTLKTELPILSSLTKRMFGICLENFIMIQKDWYSTWGEKLKKSVRNTVEMPDLEEQDPAASVVSGRLEGVDLGTTELPQRRGLEKVAEPLTVYGVETRNSAKHWDGYDILWLAASLFTLEQAMHEAGYLYLLYQAGEAFDVIAKKSVFWQAIAQDDSTKKVGWIWSKRIALPS